MKEIEEKRCVLCNKPYEYKYEMFGRGCLENIYNDLGFKKPPRFIWNKETYLCTKIAWKNRKFFLSKNKKRELTQKYIALNYLNKMELEGLQYVRNEISTEIKQTSVFSKNNKNTMIIVLNDVYKAFNYYLKFKKIIDNLKSINWQEIDEKTAKKFIDSVSFIFDVTKMTNSITYTSFCAMQYAFWQIVIVGGVLTNKPLSAKLLSNSLSLFGKEPKDLIIEDEKIIKKISDSQKFKEKINELIQKYGHENRFTIDERSPKEDRLIVFDSTDLLYALHKATAFLDAEKDENNVWNIEIRITDRYDFTEFIKAEEYADDENSLTDILSTTLNNFAVVSSKCGVIKAYNVEIRFEIKI